MREAASAEPARHIGLKRVHILRAAGYRSMPWKNGGGTTTEIAVSPAGAGLEDFDWRVSMARVESDGPFSRFAGIDRTLAILEGEGISLKVGDRMPSGLTGSSDPLAFPADLPTHAALIAGPITDLNVMTRRGRMRHSVERLVVSRPDDIALTADETLLFCHRGKVDIHGATDAGLDRLDTLHAGRDPAGLRLVPRETATLFVVRIQAAAQGD